MLPPRLLRRLVLAPLAIVIALAVVVLSPLLAVLTLIFGLRRLRPGRMRGLRLLYFALVWLAAEAAALFASLGLWVASGFGGRLRTEPYRSRHYAIMRWYLAKVSGAAERTLGLRVEIDGPRCEPGSGDGPVIVLSRHGGPGDSFLLVHYLISRYGRRPRVVMKDSLQLDPGLDVVTNRLPNVFVQHRRAGKRLFVDEIRRLARGLGAGDALVLFPEGGNWTPARWQRRIRRLEHAGRADLAARARHMPNVLGPRAGGALAAIAACPGADVIFVAHTGLDRLVSVGDVWRSLPMEQVVRATWWRVPAGDVPGPGDREAQLTWLYDSWQRIDTWVSQSRRDEAGDAGDPSRLP